MRRRSIPGTFTAMQLNSGLWQLTLDCADPVRVYVHGAGADASALLNGRQIRALELEWFAEGVMISVSGTEGVRRFRSASVLIHEPKAALYDSLPLATFDADAQRFWKRVFRLMRIPGGRLVLGLIARRRRGPGGTASH